MNDPCFLDAEQLATYLSSGNLQPSEVMLALLNRSRSINEKLNCFVHLDEQSALFQARRLEAKRIGGWRLGTLWGVPYGHKDVFATPARCPAAGATVFPLPLTSGSASTIAALDSEDALVLGALSLDEISYGATGLNSHHGDCRNPWNTEYITGGSSSGAAAAVAARAIPFALCSDTAGSTRIPAAICGVVGFKPTHGLINTSGMVPLSASQDTVGLITRSVRDCALVLDSIKTRTGIADGSPIYLKTLNARKKDRSPLQGFSIGICEHPFFKIEGNDAAVIVATAIQELERLGAKISSNPVSNLEDYDAAASVITWVEVIKNYGSHLSRSAESFTRATRMRLEAATAPTSKDYEYAKTYRTTALKGFLNSAFRGADLLLAPTVTSRTPTISQLKNDPAASVKATTSFLRSNRCFSFLGLPALSVPIGFTADGLPVGLQIIGKPWKEAEVLQVGAAYQSVTDWHSTCPTIN
jgi:aspartyl-tRNA(Asn)/glutamyl-tRNA(Gln) amidotransferase subunit A